MRIVAQAHKREEGEHRLAGKDQQLGRLREQALHTVQVLEHMQDMLPS